MRTSLARAVAAAVLCASAAARAVARLSLVHQVEFASRIPLAH